MQDQVDISIIYAKMQPLIFADKTQQFKVRVT